MRITKKPRTLFLLVFSSFFALGSRAQSVPAATQQLQLSAFAAITPVLSGLAEGRHLSVTGGVDLSFVALRHFNSAIEVRGSYPVAGDGVNRLKSFVAGPIVEYPHGRIEPYVDFLTGYGAIDYLSGGYVFGNAKYISSSTVVYSPGVGLNYSMTHHTKLRADLQYQHWDLPVVPSGAISPIAVSFGGTYMFDFNPHHNFDR